MKNAFDVDGGVAFFVVFLQDAFCVAHFIYF